MTYDQFINVLRQHQTVHIKAIAFPESCAPQMGEMLMGNSRTVLVVDDDAIVRHVYSRMLRQEGYETIEASNGAEAVNLCQQQAFAAVLMDVNMPVMDGLKATKEIRRQAAASLHMPIIGVTGYASTERAKCLAQGMDEVLDKPVSPETLFTTLQQAIQTT